MTESASCPADASQSGDGGAASAAALSAANINPRTGLATDYLNHFNEAVMLLELVPSLPACADEFMDWRPRSYRQHFEVSNFGKRALAIAAYESADPAVRNAFDGLTAQMTSILQRVADGMRSSEGNDARAALAACAAARLRPLVIRAGAVVNGMEALPDVDAIMNRR